MFLVDTNIWLERLLEQEKSKEVKDFLIEIPIEQMYISDFSLHSIGVIMSKFKMNKELNTFLNDIIDNANVKILSLTGKELIDVSKLIVSKNLDFDDAYQALIADKYNLDIVSFDKDFKKAKIKSLTPNEALRKYKASIMK